MLITRESVEKFLGVFLQESDKKHLKLIVDLSWTATVVLEFGFQCPADRRIEGKEKFFALIQKFSDARANTEGLAPVNILRDYGPNTLSNQYIQEGLSNEDFALVCDLFHRLTVGDPEELVDPKDKLMPKEKMLVWLQEAWDTGVHQQRIHSMEIEGGVMNEGGIVANFGARLAMFGEREGLLPAE